jgi:hypothetical protein
MNKYNFEQIIPKENGRLLKDRISIRKRTISIHKNLAEVLNKKFIEIFEDKQNKIILIKATNSKEKSFSIRKRNNAGTLDINTPISWMLKKEYHGLYDGKIGEGGILIDLKKPVKKYE